jgi:hypothetical protein
MEIDLGKIMDLGPLAAAPMKHVDTSGLPSPTRAIATLSDGVSFDCQIEYVETNARGIRRFRVSAELDWSTSKVVSIGLDRWPPGIMVSLRVPNDMPDERAMQFAAQIHWYVLGSNDSVPTVGIRHDDDVDPLP